MFHLKKASGKGKSSIHSFEKYFDVANYVPLDYTDTVRWTEFCSCAEQNFSKEISKLSVDDLCFEVFDQLIDSESRRNKIAIGRQRTNHIYTILHDAGILRGNLKGAQKHLEYLKADHEQICAEIDLLKDKLKEERNGKN